MGDDNTELDFPTVEEIGNLNHQQNQPQNGAQHLEGAMNEEGIEDPNLQQNQPQNGEQPSEGAVNEEKLTPEKVAELKTTVEQYQFEAKMKANARDMMRAAVNEQLEEMKRISGAVYRDERVRHLDFEEAKDKYDYLSTVLFTLELAAEDAAYQAGQQEKRYKRARDIADGKEPEKEEDPALNREYPDQDQLREEDERKKNPILDESELDALHRDAEDQKKDAKNLREALEAVRERINELNDKAREIIDRLGYYTDERYRKLDLSDIDAELMKQEQIAQHLTERIEDADDWAQKLNDAYAQAKAIAEESQLSKNLEFPEQDEVLNKQTEPDEQEIQNEVDALELAKYKQSVAKVEAAKEQYIDARMAIVSISQYIEILKTKSPEEQQGKGGAIPMDAVQGDLDKRLTLLPGQKQALEQALEEQKEAEQMLAQAKKEYIRRDMDDTLRYHWNAICDANAHYVEPDNGSAQRSGLDRHIRNLYGAFYNRHDSQEWKDMLKALGDVKIEASYDRWREAAGDYHYDIKEMDELSRQVDLAILQTQKYVDYKSGSLSAQWGIGQGAKYLREARGALEELRKIQTSLNEMDKQYQKCTLAADKRYDPKPTKKPKANRSQQRTSFSRKEQNLNRNMGGFGPHI